MPTSTYDLIEEKVLGSNVTDVTFSSIPGTYKDIVFELAFLTSNDGSNFQAQVNGDTGSNYSTTQVGGNGTTASSTRQSNGVKWIFSLAAGSPNSTNPGTLFLHLMSYANTNVNKTALARYNVATATAPATEAEVHLWRSTSAITSVKFYLSTSGATFNTNSVLRLWGVSG